MFSWGSPWDGGCPASQRGSAQGEVQLHLWLLGRQSISFIVSYALPTWLRPERPCHLGVFPSPQHFPTDRPTCILVASRFKNLHNKFDKLLNFLSQQSHSIYTYLNDFLLSLKIPSQVSGIYELYLHQDYFAFKRKDFFFSNLWLYSRTFCSYISPANLFLVSFPRSTWKRQGQVSI